MVIYTVYYYTYYYILYYIYYTFYVYSFTNIYSMEIIITHKGQIHFLDPPFNKNSLILAYLPHISIFIRSMMIYTI